MAGASRKIEMDKKVRQCERAGGYSAYPRSPQVIQAGRYDNKSTAEERDEFLVGRSPP